MGNHYSEWADARGDTRRTVLVTLVACAVGATAGGAVMLSLVGSPVTQPGVSSISPRAIVREIGASEAKKTVQDQPTAETPLRPAGTNEVATQTDAEHQPEVQKQESRKHNRAVSRSHEPYWRGRFVRALSQPRFSSW